MTNVFRLPVSGLEFTAEQALCDAINDHVTDVLVIGYAQDGSLYIRSSRMTCAEALFLANKAARWAESGGDMP